MELVRSARRRFQRGLKRKPMGLIKKLQLRQERMLSWRETYPLSRPISSNMIVVPEMIESVVSIYNGKTFKVELKPEMVGHYLASSPSPTSLLKHGHFSIGATHSSRFIPLK
ncbi:ribosomal protein S19 [Batrachochytrium salamandrivorans]|nr:ribosomal protein S19 [Batrachochytrium salamandrivorans]